jgi:hypothetical protein
MKTIRSKIMSLSAVAIMALAGINPAFAGYLANASGNWTVVGNQSVGALVIVQAASANLSKPISGTIFGSPIQGYYTPSTGKIVFARNWGATGTPFQLYQGNVSRVGGVNRIGGTFYIWNASGGGLADEGAEYNFSAQK